MKSTALTYFSFDTKRVRTAEDGTGTVWFVASDVAEALGHTNPERAVRDHCKKQMPISELVEHGSSTYQPGTMLIPESDLYRLILRSRLPSAEAFQDWVFEEVLPQIRRTGKYAPARDALLLEHLEQSVDGLLTFLNLSRNDKRKALEAVARTRTDLDEVISEDMLADLGYFRLRALTKRTAYVSPSSVKEVLQMYGFMDGPWITPYGLKFGRYCGPGTKTTFDTEWRLDTLEEIQRLQDSNAPRWDPNH